MERREKGEIRLLLMSDKKRYDNDFLEKLNRKRIDIISSIVLRLVIQNKI